MSFLKLTTLFGETEQIRHEKLDCKNKDYEAKLFFDMSLVWCLHKVVVRLTYFNSVQMKVIDMHDITTQTPLLTNQAFPSFVNWQYPFSDFPLIETSYIPSVVAPAIRSGLHKRDCTPKGSGTWLAALQNFGSNIENKF